MFITMSLLSRKSPKKVTKKKHNVDHNVMTVMKVTGGRHEKFPPKNYTRLSKYKTFRTQNVDNNVVTISLTFRGTLGSL